MQPVVTVFCPFTRRWAVDSWLEGFAKVKHDPKQTNLCFIVDCEEPYIVGALRRFAEKRGYRSFHIKMNEHNRPNETKLSIRRAAVADVHNQSKDLIALTDGEIIIGLEDDTVFDRWKSFAQLYVPLLDDQYVGFVEGVQMGRWGANIVGVWRADDPNNPQVVQTCLPGEGFEAIDAGGFYGFATRPYLYMNHEYYTSTAQPWGPDVNFGLWVRRQGFKCLVNWDLLFGHQDFNVVAYPDDRKYNLVSVVFNKDQLTGKWVRTDHERDRY